MRFLLKDEQRFTKHSFSFWWDCWFHPSAGYTAFDPSVRPVCLFQLGVHSHQQTVISVIGWLLTLHFWLWLSKCGLWFCYTLSCCRPLFNWVIQCFWFAQQFLDHIPRYTVQVREFIGWGQTTFSVPFSYSSPTLRSLLEFLHFFRVLIHHFLLSFCYFYHHSVFLDLKTFTCFLGFSEHFFSFPHEKLV
jgi:hypothetical protein